MQTPFIDQPKSLQLGKLVSIQFTLTGNIKWISVRINRPEYSFEPGMTGVASHLNDLKKNYSLSNVMPIASCCIYFFPSSMFSRLWTHCAPHTHISKNRIYADTNIEFDTRFQMGFDFSFHWFWISAERTLSLCRGWRLCPFQSSYMCKYATLLLRLHFAPMETERFSFSFSFLLFIKWGLSFYSFSNGFHFFFAAIFFAGKYEFQIEFQCRTNQKVSDG